MPKRYMESHEGASCTRRWRHGSRRQLGEHPSQASSALGSCLPKAWLFPSLRLHCSQGEGWGQIATEMLSFCHGKKWVLNYPSPTPPHTSSIWWTVEASVFQNSLWWQLPWFYGWFSSPPEGRGPGGHRSKTPPPPAGSSHFPCSPLVPAALLAPGKPVAASQARARRSGWQRSLPGLRRGPCPCCIPPPSTTPLVHRIHLLSP